MPSPAAHCLQYLIRQPNLPIASAWAATEADELIEIPFLGRISAGMPIDACLENGSIEVPASMVRRNTYALRVCGNSMVDCNIFDGDVIVIEQRESAENGETAVVMINDQEVTLKKLYIEKSGVRLQPANQHMAPIHLRNCDIQVLGMVMGVVRQPEITH
ncbi:LexA family protein [Halomonas halocynthiae]|uniref:LexA family protein n=1 Tax=Halomonas halocynthiae TaxID=176290 RepID=UPI0003FDFA12|nr:LexA family transcriptional regulator [Halomonas halocynthiae]